MEKWRITEELLSGWRLIPAVRSGGDSPKAVFPRYRGAFEEGEKPPKAIRISTRFSGADIISLGGSFGDPWDFSGDSFGNGRSGTNEAQEFAEAVVRFRGRREFGVSVEIDREYWGQPRSSRGWFLFRAGGFLLGLWSSLPATWLAQAPDGSLLETPWRELWTFGKTHFWICRICDTSSLNPEELESLQGLWTASPPCLSGLMPGPRFRTREFPV